MANTSMTIDIGKAMRNLVKTNKAIKQGAEVGVGRAMLQLKNDMVMQRPTAPIKEGFLRGSTSIFVQNKKLDTPMAPGEKTDKQVNQHSVRIKKTEIVGLIGVNVPYAARWHEVPAKFSEPSAGNKYLESKMSRNKMTYKKIITNAIVEVKPWLER